MRDSVTLTVNLELTEAEEAQENADLNLKPAVQENTIIEIQLNGIIETPDNPPIDSLTTNSANDISSIEYPTNETGQKFAQSSDGSFISSVTAPNVRTCINANETADGHDSGGEIGPFCDAAENEEDFIDEPEPLVVIAPNAPTQIQVQVQLLPLKNSVTCVELEAINKKTVK